VRSNRASVLAALGRPDEALQGFRQALRHAPDLAPAGQGLVDLLRAEPRLLADAAPELDELLARAIRTPWGRPQAIAPLLIARLGRHRALAAAVDRVAAAWPRRLQWPDCLAGDADTVLGDALLIALLENALVADIGLERWLVTLRGALLQRALADVASDAVELRFGCALARQCFLDEYVYELEEAEDAAAAALQARVESALAAGALPPAQVLAVLACYRPLHGIDAAASLAGRTWPAALDAVFEQQFRQPQREQALMAALPQLTAIEDPTSRAVRRQYEENPYPRWVALPPQTTRESLASYLRRRVPGIDPAWLPRTARIEALNAGCGTGQHPIEMALRIDGIQVLAIDLSRRSLAYAARMAEQLGVANVVFAQADLLELSGLERNFDLIESSGVLHHLADPGRGLAALARMLREHGLLRLSLYSDSGRQAVVAARALVAARGYGTGIDDIRRCRVELMREDADPQARRVTAHADFYATSECRDLIFHVQEHRLSLPGIERLLDAHGLEFVGIEPEARALAAFRAAFPAPASLRRLQDWHAFEQAHPDAFAGMYTVWARLRG
jgi:SAM-dependent methyltransferase